MGGGGLVVGVVPFFGVWVCWLARRGRVCAKVFLCGCGWVAVVLEGCDEQFFAWQWCSEGVG